MKKNTKRPKNETSSKKKRERVRDKTLQLNHGPKTPVTLKLCALGTGCSSRRRRQAEGIRNNLFLICAPGQKETPQNEIIPWPQSAAAQQQQQQQRSIIKQKKKLQEQQQQQQRPENRFPSSKRFDENFDCVLKEGEKEVAGGGRRAGARAEAGPRMWQTCFFRAATEGTGAGSGPRHRK